MQYRILQHVPGGRANVSRAELAVLFARMEHDELVETVFYDGAVRTVDDFADLMADERTWLYLVCGREGTLAESSPPGGADLPRIRGSVPLAFCWLNNHTGSGAMIHFCVFRDALAEARDIGRFVTRMLLLAKAGDAVPHAVCAGAFEAMHAYREAAEQDGTRPFCLDALYGLTPAVFRHALKFVQSFGFQKKGELPFAARLRRRGRERLSAGVLTCLTRRELL